MPLTILTYPHPLLAKPSSEITQVTPEIRELAAEMAETMYKAEGIGLAAPQVGKPIRLITVDVTGPERREGLMTLVNPRLTPVPEAGFQEGEEGCLSVSEYRANVKRHAKVFLEATDLDGKPIRMEADGILAVCLQHETDHLEGVLFIDRISRLKRVMYEAKVKKRLRQPRSERHL